MKHAPWIDVSAQRPGPLESCAAATQVYGIPLYVAKRPLRPREYAYRVLANVRLLKVLPMILPIQTASGAQARLCSRIQGGAPLPGGAPARPDTHLPVAYWEIPTQQPAFRGTAKAKRVA